MNSFTPRLSWRHGSSGCSLFNGLALFLVLCFNLRAVKIHLFENIPDSLIRYLHDMFVAIDYIITSTREKQRQHTQKIHPNSSRSYYKQRTKVQFDSRQWTHHRRMLGDLSLGVHLACLWCKHTTHLVNHQVLLITVLHHQTYFLGR